MLAGIDAKSNSSVLDAADGFVETAYLLSEPANAAHLRRSIRQYRAGQMRTKKF
jgi:PHD/YefM family antitoxin component YafN of YafNO toxin-antitoxin module